MIMATFFSPFTCSSSSSLILIHLFLITTVNLFLRTNAAAVDDICGQTKEPPRCVSILGSIRRIGNANLPELAGIAIDTATYNAGQCKIKVHNLMIGAKDPNLHTLYSDCENIYFDALDALSIAPEYLQTRRYGKLVEAAGIVGRAVSGCGRAVANDSILKRENEDLGIVVDALALIARKL